MRTQATSVPLVPIYDSTSWSSVQTAMPAPKILFPGLSASNARKMMSAPTGSFTGLIDTAPSAYALSLVLCHPICCDGAPPVAVEPAPLPTERIGAFHCLVLVVDHGGELSI